MPVHRHVHEKLSTVWVLRSELDAWSKRRQLSAASKPVPVSRSRTRFLIWAAAAIAIAAAIVLASRPAPLPFERILIQRMTSSGRVGVAAISPDGRLIAYADGDSGDQRLILKEVSSGTERRLFADSAILIMGLAFSADGGRLFLMKVTTGDPAARLEAIDLRDNHVMQVASGLASTVQAGPDGRLAFVRERAGKAVLCLLDAAGGEREIYESRLPVFLDYPVWSPDGRRLAFTRVNPGERRTELATLDVTSGAASAVGNEKWLHVIQAGWTSDQRYLVIAARASEVEPYKLWRIDTRDARPHAIIGDPEDHYRGLSMSRDGRRLVTREEKLIVRISLLNGDGSEQEVLPSANRSAYLSWSATGEVLFDAPDGDSRRIWAMRIPEGKPRALTGKGFALRPSGCGADGSVVYRYIREGREEIWHLDAAGNLRYLGAGSNSLPKCTPDGSTVLFSAPGPDSWPVAWLVSTQGGERVALTRERAENAEPSPQGDRFAAFSAPMDANSQRPPSEIAVFRLPDGGPLQRTSIALTVALSVGIRWSRDGRAVYYVERTRSSDAIWEQPLDGSAPREIRRFTGEQIQSFDWSPDGKILAISRAMRTQNALLIQDVTR